MFTRDFEGLVNPEHPLVKVGGLIDWTAFEKKTRCKVLGAPGANTRLMVSANGAIEARVVDRLTGQSAVQARAAHRSSKLNFNEMINAWVNDTARAAKISKTDVSESQEDGWFELTTEFTAPGYAQSMRGALLVFKPALVSRRNFVPLTQPERKHPVILEPQSFSETATITLPENYAVEDLPPTAEIKTAFGSYAASCVHNNSANDILLTRSLTINASEIPAADYAKVRQFYEAIRKAENTPVVLVRKER